MKYNLYIDECGDQNLANFDEQFPIFTLCGVVVADIRYYGKLNDVYAQSLSFVLERTVFYLDGLSDNDVELHTVVEMRGKKEDDALRLYYSQLLDKGTYWVSAETEKIRKIVHNATKESECHRIAGR